MLFINCGKNGENSNFNTSTYPTPTTVINQEDNEAINQAVKLLRRDEVVGFPTETVYGLGANAFSSDACKKIFVAKNRPSDNPLIVHVSSMEMLKRCIEDGQLTENSVGKLLIDTYWPGPLTIIFKKSKLISEFVSGGLNTVGIRMPNHSTATNLISQLDYPIAAPSANLSGSPSPTSAQHVFSDLNGRIPLIIDGGDCQFGLESTVVDIQSYPPVLLRPGSITFESLKVHLPNIVQSTHTNEPSSKHIIPRAPGMKYKHYTPKATVILFNCGENTQLMIEKMLAYYHNEIVEKPVAIMHTHPNLQIPEKLKEECIIIPTGNADYPATVAKELFSSLRLVDVQKCATVFVEGIEAKQEGLGVMNRLTKAAAKII